jgi:hypothetical protein
MPWDGAKIKPEIVCPLTLNKGTAKEEAKLMTMTMAASKEEPTKGTFTLAWGKHTLTAPLVVHVGK